VDTLTKEIAEFHSDKKDLAETKVRLVKEGREKFTALQKAFITKTARVVEATVSTGLTREMTQLKEDIEFARKNDFGRRIFESFASEYASSHLNEKSDTAKLIRAIQQKDSELQHAAKIVAESKRLTESKEAELKVAKDTSRRKDIMGELLGPLAGDRRQVMRDLLESVQTDRLYSAFDKYLPAVMDGGPMKKREAIVEGKGNTSNKEVITGNRQATHIGSQEKTAEIFDIRRLAGLKV
jgi:hypothetical protein